MKVYFNMCISDLSNSYVVINEDTRQAIIVDPGIITYDIIKQVEGGAHELCAVLVTRKRELSTAGIITLLKIYTPKIYACDTESFLNSKVTLLGDGKETIAGLEVEHFCMTGSSADSVAYKIGNFIFTGDSLSAGIVGDPSGSIHSKKILLKNLKEKIFSAGDDCVLLPSVGPPVTVGAARSIL